MTIIEIAKAAGVSVHVVKTYGILFFDIVFEGTKQDFSIGVSNRLIRTIEHWKTGKQVCDKLSISRQWLFELRKKYNMPCKDFGTKNIYYDLEIVRKYVKKANKQF